MNLAATERTAVGRTVIAAIIVVVLIVAAGAGVYYYASRASTTTTSSGATNSTTSTTGVVNTLLVDDETWPNGNLNQLNAIGAIPYPNWLDYSVYQSLVGVNGTTLYANGTLQLEPMLAASWNESSSGTNWTFQLQKGVDFSNGDPFNAYQVWAELYGFYYLSGNSSGWAVGYTVFNMNTADFGPSTIALMSSTSTQLITPTAQMLSIMTNSSWPIYVVNQNEIGFNLKAAFQYFPAMWVQFTGLMFDTQYVLNHGGYGTPAAFNTAFNYSPIPGTGPYTVSNVVPNSAVTFTQNPTYWAKGWTAAQIAANPYMDPGHVKSIVITVKADDVSRYVDLSNGGADLAPILTADWGSVINNSKYSYFVMPNGAANIVGAAFNTARYPTNNTDFRNAIVNAINFTAISDLAFLGTQGGGVSPFVGPDYPPYTQLYDLGNLPPYSLNASLAKADLAASGINVKTLPTIDFGVIQGCGVCLATAQLISSEVATTLGVTITVDVVPSSSYAPPLIAGAGTYAVELNESQTILNMMWFGTATFAPDEPTPADSWLTWVSNDTSANNYAVYYNPVVQTCVNDITNGTPQAQLTAACTAAQKQVYDDAPYIWLGSVKLFFGGGSLVWNNAVIKSFLADPVFSGQSSTAILNTIKLTNGQDQ
jgi:ABC-type transport system substrate-binding protein